MNNKEYTNYVERGHYPKDNIVPLDNPFISDAGVIQNLLNTPINGAAIITSKNGSVRSNHYHNEDFHYLYIISGSMEYYERIVDEVFVGKPFIVTAGQMVFTPPKRVHKTVFLEDTVMISLSKRNRDHESHEQDVVRVEF